MLTEKRMIEFTGGADAPEEKVTLNERVWIDAFKKGEESSGTFLKAEALTQAILLGGVALRAGKKVVYDPDKIKIANMEEANQYLTREYRPGWEIGK